MMPVAAFAGLPQLDIFGNALEYGAEAAWWLGHMARLSGKRAVRALRILVEAVK